MIGKVCNDCSTENFTELDSIRALSIFPLFVPKTTTGSTINQIDSFYDYIDSIYNSVSSREKTAKAFRAKSLAPSTNTQPFPTQMSR